MPVRNIDRRDPNFQIPTDEQPEVKINITDDGGTVHTVLDTVGGALDDNTLISGSITKTATDRIGSFTFRLVNDKGRYLDEFDGGEVVEVYSDYSTASTLIFRGRIDNVMYGLDNSTGFFLEVDGRDKPELVDKTITGTHVAQKADLALSSVLFDNYSDVTLTFWNGSQWAEATYDSDADSVSWDVSVSSFPTTLVNTSYQHKKGWSVIKEVCGIAGLDCYMHYDGTKWTLRTFVEESISNGNGTISYGGNLMSMSQFGTDNTRIRNRVIVYGQRESSNILLLKTEEDSTSQSNLWVKDRIIDASELSSMEEVQDKADFELSRSLNPNDEGNFRVIMNPELYPGDMINATVPYSNVNGSYKVKEFTHNLGLPLSTDIQVSKRKETFDDIFVEKINPDEFTKDFTNVNSMENSYTVYFNESPSKMNHSNTEESNGVLQLQSGQTSGTATSDIITTDKNVTQVELRRFEANDATGDDSYEVTNNGSDWETIDTVEFQGGQSTLVHTFDNTSGNSLGFRINMSRASASDSSPKYESVSLLYK